MFYRPASLPLCQGDIIEQLSNIHAKDGPQVLRRTTLSGGREGFEAVKVDEEKPGSEFLMPAHCCFTRSMLLTYDCEIDKKGAKHLTIAMIRPLDPSLPRDQQEIIRKNKKFAFFYLPLTECGSPESYVDFRRITTVAPILVNDSRIVARLSEESLRAILFQFYRFMARIDLSRAVLPPLEQENA